MLVTVPATSDVGKEGHVRGSRTVRYATLILVNPVTAN